MTDDLAEKAHDLLDDLAVEYPHLKEAVRTVRSTEPKLKSLEDKLVNSFTDGLRRILDADK